MRFFQFTLILGILLFVSAKSYSAENTFFIDWGPDKTLHVVAGSIIGLNYSLYPFERPEDAYFVAILVDVGITLGKEVIDSFTGGSVELADIGAGLLPAVMVSSCLFALERYSGIRLRLAFGERTLKIYTYFLF